MSNTLPNLGLTGNFEQCEDALDAINQNFLTLDALAQNGIVAQVSGLPPTGVTGEKYILNSTGEVFVFTDQWVSLGVKKGWVAFDCDQQELIVYNGMDWVPVQATSDILDPVNRIINGVAPGGVGQLVYNSGSAWVLADHSDIDKVAVAMITQVDAGSFKVQTSGPVTIPSHGFNIGEYYFGDENTIGEATNVRPATGSIFKSAFHVVDADTVELLLQNEPYIASDPATVNTSPVGVSTYRSTVGQSLTSGSFNSIQFNVDQDVNSFVNLSPSNTGFSFTQEGTYFINGQIALGSASFQGNFQSMLVRITTSGGGFPPDYHFWLEDAFSATGNWQNRMFVRFSATIKNPEVDSFNITVNHNNTGNDTKVVLPDGDLNWIQITKLPEEVV